VLFAPSDNLPSFALSQLLKIVETLFYGSDEEGEISLDYDDIYAVIAKGTTTRYYEGSGTDLSLVALETLNTPKGFRDTAGVIALFEIHPDYPILEVAEGMELIEKMMPEESAIVFETRTTQTSMHSVRVTCLVSRYVNFQVELQHEIDNTETYFGKAAVIVDAFAEGMVGEKEADFLASINGIDSQDLRTIYTLIYTTRSELVELMRLLRNDSLSLFHKEEAIADLAREGTLDTGLLEEIALTQKLSVDRIVTIIDLKNSGKLPLQPLEMPENLKKKYPRFSLALSANIPVLTEKENFEKDKKSGMLIVDANELSIYENGDSRLYVDKELDRETIESFVREYKE
jgi:hypothetical protein